MHFEAARVGVGICTKMDSISFCVDTHHREWNSWCSKLQDVRPPSNEHRRTGSCNDGSRPPPRPGGCSLSQPNVSPGEERERGKCTDSVAQIPTRQHFHLQPRLDPSDQFHAVADRQTVVLLSPLAIVEIPRGGRQRTRPRMSVIGPFASITAASPRTSVTFPTIRTVRPTNSSRCGALMRGFWSDIVV